MAQARLNRLTYAYPGSHQAALNDVSLLIDGGLTMVAGPSGGGKSTLLRVLNGLVPHFHGGRVAGEAESAGFNIIATPTRVMARSVGFVFQDPELQAVYDTVEREVAFGLENLGVPARAMPARVGDALAQVGAEHLVGRRVSTLSGGERQRVALASVLAMQPRTVVLDEPTSQLDPKGATLVLDACERVVASSRSVVLSEHRFAQLQPLAETVVIVDQGRVETHAARDSRPGRVEVARLPPAEPGPCVWALEHATVGYAGHPLIADLDLAGYAGQVVALSGANGSGKTTLLRTIAGLLRPLSGKVERRPVRIAYLPQNPGALLHRPTVRSEVELTLRRTDSATSADDVLRDLGLFEVAERYPRDLSSGERQRAALAAVLAGTPALVLLDEPTRGMDPKARIALIELVRKLRDRGGAVVVATHDADLLAAIADRVVEL
ncbi:MAG TPA: ATP-binding cassette domain-containing protein [Candidatus Dormibacteraeota bacterium]